MTWRLALALERKQVPASAKMSVLVSDEQGLVMALRLESS
jgi:hypothetical protein